MAFGHLRHGAAVLSGGTTPRNPPRAGSSRSMAFGHLRHGSRGAGPGTTPEPRWRCGAAARTWDGRPAKVATRVREAVESHACHSLVSAPADHSAVVTNGDGDRPRRNQALALWDRWGAGDQVKGPGRAPAPGE